MASQSVLELAVNTGKWDAGLRKAQSALQNFTQSNGGLQQALDKEGKSMQAFVQMMGKMDSTAKTAKGQMNDYRSTIEQLTMQYNRMTEAQQKSIGQDYLHAIDQLKQKYQAVNDEIQEMNRGLSSTKIPDAGVVGGGKLDGALQVFAGNMMTKAAGWAMSFASELGDAVKQGIELAKAGEGVRAAFERLGRGDLLDGLREATHGTVTDLELMKAAVKFNDFKLPLDELGTMLAFAQQKAKDTGQSVDYMVDSIVTGLGRQSLMILDNLGLSASDIKERMKETGDMTKAVGEIIREQMSKAGDYVETAADRAAQADVELKNAMEELGRTFMPIQEAGVGMFHSLEVAALKLLNNALKPLVETWTAIGRMQKAYRIMGGGSAVASQIDALNSSKDKRGTYFLQTAQYRGNINALQRDIDAIKRWQGGERSEGLQATISGIKGKYGMTSLNTAPLRAALDAQKKMLEEYKTEALKILNPVADAITDPTNIGGGVGGGKNTPPKVEEILPTGSLADLNQQLAELRKQQSLVTSTEEWEKYSQKISELTIKVKELKGELKMEGVSISDMMNGKLPTRESIIKKGQQRIENFKMPEQKESPQMLDSMKTLSNGISGIASGLQQMGITIPQEIQSVIGILQGITTILTAIQTINSVKFWAGGGIVHAASGMVVPGTSFGYDGVPSLLTSGELVLNQAQQGNLASQLQAASMINGGGGGGHDYVSGQNIYLGTNNYLKGSGQGQLVTTRMLRQYGLIS